MLRDTFVEVFLHRFVSLSIACTFTSFVGNHSYTCLLAIRDSDTLIQVKSYAAVSQRMATGSGEVATPKADRASSR